MLRLFIFSIFVLLISCQNNKDTGSAAPVIINTADSIVENRIRNSRTKLQQADLVVRSGNDFTSNAFKSFSNKDYTFSHSGFVFLEDSIYYVYHLVAGAENPSEVIKREPYDSFVSPRKNTAFGIFRYDMTNTEKKDLYTNILSYYDNKLKFDKELDLSTDDKMYCSEMIYKVLLKTTHNRIMIKQTVLEKLGPKMAALLPKNALGRSYIALDDLYLNEHCKEIDKFIYSSVKVH